MPAHTSSLSRCPSCGTVGCTGGCQPAHNIPNTRSAMPSVGRSHGARVTGRVVSHPIVAPTVPGAAKLVRRLFPLLLLVWFLTTPGVIGALLVLGLAVGFVAWVLRSVAGASGSLGIGRTLRSALGGWLRLGSGYDPGSEMVFRVQPSAGTGVRIVRVAGHTDGIGLGDEVAVTGMPTPRGLASTRLSNRTTGVTLMSRSLPVTVLLIVLNLYLLAVIVWRFQ